MKKATLAGLVFAACASAQWIDVQGAYKPKDNMPTTRIEAGANLGKLNLYEFTDIETTPTRNFPKSVYNETRASYSLGAIAKEVSSIGIAAEYNGGTDYQDTVRFGFTYTPKLHDKNFTVLKAFPLATASKGPQASIFTSQTMGRFIPSVLLDYNTKSGTTYAELELEYKVAKHFSLYAQQRGFGTPHRPELQQVIGVKFRP